ncbi:hypothetical protein SteCoe_22514 [Stentor coeruleus]|uniref:Ubiquitin fusion degradation protein UFD1 N-terminal subdomain 1 domain-containing protein n=1 Tax=Stentor coeruleus TaxID=5963 RepID=A0A1R2BM65_9CILI|nr:hypothetical protein SteCoe_22514 [Stentor coeruleus]
MNDMTQNDKLTFAITQVLPIFMSKNYRASMEYSDKLILPGIVLLTIRKAHLPLPPVFSLKYLREDSPPIICGALEFSAPESTIYAPSWMMKKLGKKRTIHGAEAVLELLRPKRKNSLIFPQATRVEIYYDTPLNSDACKKALLRYTIINKGETLPLQLDSKVFRVTVISLLPKNKCIVWKKDLQVIVLGGSSKNASVERDFLNTIPLIESINVSPKTRCRQRSRHQSPIAMNSTCTYMNKTCSCDEYINMYNTDLLPWDKEDQFRQESNFLPEIGIGTDSIQKNIEKDTKPLTGLGFPYLKSSGKRMITTAIFIDGKKNDTGRKFSSKFKTNSVSY